MDILHHYMPYINFVIFLVILYFVTRKPIDAYSKSKLDDYKNRYQKSQSEKNEILKKLEEVNEALGQADARIEKLEKENELEIKLKVEALKNLFNQQVEQAKKDSESEKDAVIQTLQNEMIKETMGLIYKNIENHIHSNFSDDDFQKYSNQLLLELKVSKGIV